MSGRGLKCGLFFEEPLDGTHDLFNARGYFGGFNLNFDVFLLITDFCRLFHFWIINLKNAVAGPLPKEGLAKSEEVCGDDEVEQDEKKSAKDVAEDQRYQLFFGHHLEIK